VGYVAVVLLALVLRLLALGRFSLGNDEIEEARWSRLPFGELLKVTALDGAHPPLEFLGQAAIERAHAPEWVRRVPSVLAGVATVALVVFLASRWFGEVAGLAAGVLLACSPIHVRYSQEVRPYAIGLFFLAMSLAALEEYRRRPSRTLALLWFLGVMAASYTLYFAGLIARFASVSLIALYRKAGLRNIWRTLPLALAGWALLYGPWLPYVLSIARRPPPFPREVLDTEWFRYRLEVLGTGDWRIEPISIGSYAFWALVVIGLLAAWRSRPAALAAIWLLVGGAAELLVLQLRPHYPAVRHLLPAWLAAIFLAGYGVSKLGRTRYARFLAVCALAIILFFDSRSLSAYYDNGRSEWKTISSYLARNAHSGEHLVVANTWVFRNLGYYWYDQRVGPEGLQLERRTDEIVGPAWLVIAACNMSSEIRERIDSMPLRGLFPSTNGCEIRFVPTGRRLALSGGICLGGV
jgi:4-amino-4-deoxy-L-arabinose transferase-like glycosyltransferase